MPHDSAFLEQCKSLLDHATAKHSAISGTHGVRLDACTAVRLVLAEPDSTRKYQRRRVTQARGHLHNPATASNSPWCYACAPNARAI